jgi:hypothetical protein
MSKYSTDAITLAQGVVPRLKKGMLCMADRFFTGYKLWRAAAQTGADLLWRTRQNARLEIDRRFPDGSYRSRIYASTSDRRRFLQERVSSSRTRINSRAVKGK